GQPPSGRSPRSHPAATATSDLLPIRRGPYSVKNVGVRSRPFMPNRLVSLAILLGWAIAAGALFTRDVLPNLMVGPPPDLRAVVAAEDFGRPTTWALLAVGQEANEMRSVGQAVTKAERRRDGSYWITSDAWVDTGELLHGTAVESAQGDRLEIAGEYEVDPSGNLEHFRAGVREFGSRSELLAVTGKL